MQCIKFDDLRCPLAACHAVLKLPDIIDSSPESLSCRAMAHSASSTTHTSPFLSSQVSYRKWYNLPLIPFGFTASSSDAKENNLPALHDEPNGT
jgi:hypothetical protein